MTHVKRQKTVLYSAKEMYSLVCDIASYPDFLLWCESTDIIEQNDDSIKASISIAIGKIKQSFTTENTMQTGKFIDMSLVRGPFKKLKGRWEFYEHNNKECTVSLNMNFEFNSVIVKYTFGIVFNKIADSLVDSFVDRAKYIYGSR